MTVGKPDEAVGRNAAELVEATVRRMPDQCAFVTDDGQMTYAVFGALVDSAAHGLTRQGVKPGDRVAAKVSKSVEGVALFYATLKIGAIYVPVNPGFTAEETAWILSDAEPTLTIADGPEEVEALARAGGDTKAIALRRCDGQAAILEPELGSAQKVSAVTTDAAAMLYTSGTTGRPKGAIMSHKGIVRTFTSINRKWRIDSRDRLLHVLPTYHAHGLIMATACPLFAGATIILMPKFDLDAMVAKLEDSTLVMAVPTIYRRMLEHPEFTREKCRSLRLLACGSAPLSADLFDAVHNRTGLSIVERYASTESGMIAANPADAPRRGSVGQVLDGMEMRLADENDRPVGAGEIGRIQARGAHVFLGYWRRSQLAADSMTGDGYFSTGDLGRLDDEGYLYIVGRETEMIISGGYNVYPREVELALEQVAGVDEAAVFAIDHPDYGEAVAAAVSLDDPCLTEETILADLRMRLTGYKCPKRIIVVDKIPRNELGKILKAGLKNRMLSESPDESQNIATR